MADFSRRNFFAALGARLTLARALAELVPRERSGGLRLPAGDPRELPAKDERLEVRTIDTPHLPQRPISREQWEERSERLRKHILACAGLWPLPERTPLNAQVFGRVQEENFSVEKVYFESYPRFYCTGNLYRPRSSDRKPPRPGILCPHGHWNYGRLENSPNDQNGSSIPQRCMNFALQGSVCFAYDMVGYNDSFQVPHRYGLDEKAPWGLSPEALRLGLWGASMLGLQLWNSMRAVDFLCSLPDVDAERLGVTGASGGGTQTFLLTAVEERVRASAPVNMISHFMQGGDLCENAPNLRIDTDNVEIGALAAPRPLLMVSATGDWTADTPRVEFPAVRAVYALLGAEDRVANEHFPYQHNYNRHSREVVYRFFARWLAREPGKADVAHIEERGEFKIDPGRLLVFSRREPPAEALETTQVMDALVANARRQLEASRPQSAEGLEARRRQLRPVFRAALMAEPPSPEDLRWWPVGQETSPRSGAAGSRLRFILRRLSAGDRIPGQATTAPGWARAAALVVHPEGSEAALGAPGSPTPLLRELTKRGCVIVSMDTFQTGEAREPARKMQGRFFSTYNRTDDMQRVQDILTSLEFMRAAWAPQKVLVIGEGIAGLWCLLARALLQGPVSMAADAADFENENDQAYLEKLHIPLLRRAGDFQTAALLGGTSPLLLHNVGNGSLDAGYRHSFALVNAADRLHVSRTQLGAPQIVEWLLAR